MSNPTTKLVLDFIDAYLGEKQIPPSVREIASACHLTPPAVETHLAYLEGRGYIRRIPKVARGIVRLQPENEGGL